MRTGRNIAPSLTASSDVDGQRLAVGRRRGSTLDTLDGVAAAIGDLDQPRSSVSSADAGKGRAFPSHAGGRSVARSQLHRPCGNSRCIRSVASGLQHSAASRCVASGGSDQPLSHQLACIPGEPSTDRVRPRRAGSPSVDSRSHQVRSAFDPPASAWPLPANRLACVQLQSRMFTKCCTLISPWGSSTSAKPLAMGTRL